MNRRILWIVSIVLTVAAVLVTARAVRPRTKPIVTPQEANDSSERTSPDTEYRSWRLSNRTFAVAPRAAIKPQTSNIIQLQPDVPNARELEGYPMTDAEEDEAMAMFDNSSRQRVWRSSFASERQDDAWTQRMQQELRQTAASLFGDHQLVVENLSCHETICRMYLQFEDQLDADAFKTAMNDPNLHYEFQSLDPTFKGEGFDHSDYTYEVMVQRPRPADLPARDPAEAAREAAAQAAEMTISANGG